VRQVFVKGNRRTRPEVVAACVAPVLKARTFGDVLGRTAEAAKELKRLGIFKSVNLVLDDIPEGASGQGGDSSACDLRVELVESKLTRIEVKTSTTVGENEPDVVRPSSPSPPPPLHPSPLTCALPRSKPRWDCATHWGVQRCCRLVLRWRAPTGGSTGTRASASPTSSPSSAAPPDPAPSKPTPPAPLTASPGVPSHTPPTASPSATSSPPTRCPRPASAMAPN